MDPRCISIDIETYGFFKKTLDGRPLPPKQTVFHPMRCVHTDGVAVGDLIQSVSITLPRTDPRDGGSWDVTALSRLVPGETFVFIPKRPGHWDMVRRWLLWADSLLLVNGLFDLMMLRTVPELTPALCGNHTLIDLVVLSFLQNDARDSHSLKNLGTVLNTHRYEEDSLPKHGHRFENAEDPKNIKYNAEDTHNCILSIAEVASHVLRRYGAQSTKLSPSCLTFYSNVMWSTLRMAEAGIPMSISRLQKLETALLRRIDRLNAECQTAGLQLGGKGSEKSKTEFLDRVISEIDASLPAGQSVLDHPSLVKTPELGKISFSQENFNLFKEMLPDGSSLETLLSKAETFSKFQKLVSTYTFPMLRHKRKDPTKKNSVLIPRPISRRNSMVADSRTTIGMAYPTWYITPSDTKDGQGASGGTKQGRITCKDPSAQTFPPVIQNCIQSRFAGGHIIKFDLSQIELRVAALFSGEPVLLNEYRQADPDLHTKMAILLFTQETLVEKYGPNFQRVAAFRSFERQAGKHTGFGNIYLASDETMQSTVLKMTGQLLPLQLFTDMVNSRPTKLPVLWAWQQGLLEQAERTGEILLPITGQSRSFPGFRRNTFKNHDQAKSQMNEIVNMPIQTFAGDILLDIQHQLNSILPGMDRPATIIPFQNVYDALFCDVHPSEAQRFPSVVAEAVRLCETRGLWHKMAQITGHMLPLTMEVTTVHVAA